MGGAERFLARLDEFFERSNTTTIFPPTYYWHGNEPDLHAAWIYSAFDQPVRAATRIRWIAESFYDLTERGIPGNDDSGTLSAWYVFASLGMYPLAGTPEYLLAGPLLNEATVHLADHELSIRGATEWPAEVHEIRLDDQPAGSHVSHQRLMSASRLDFIFASN